MTDKLCAEDNDTPFPKPNFGDTPKCSTEASGSVDSTRVIAVTGIYNWENAHIDIVRKLAEIKSVIDTLAARGEGLTRTAVAPAWNKTKSVDVFSATLPSISDMSNEPVAE